MTAMERIKERYQNDPRFHALVDTLRREIVELELSRPVCTRRGWVCPAATVTVQSEIGENTRAISLEEAIAAASEIREAAMFAAYMVESARPTGPFARMYQCHGWAVTAGKKCPTCGIPVPL